MLSALIGLQGPAILFTLRPEESEPPRLTLASPGLGGLVGAAIQPVPGVGLVARGAALAALHPDTTLSVRGVRWQRTDPPLR